MAVPTGELGREALVRYLEDGFACAQACAECATACLQPAGPAEPNAAQRLDLRCADVCEHTSRMLTQHGRYDVPGLRAQVELCAATCAACAEDYERLAASPRAAERAEACRRCEQACRGFLGSLA
ncbi:hypothetical protein [Streptomyces synnematoformans]|uniref:Four-helix bundle copper-binding protein n=1 Tax=Streptomyces synnematoformans TaxID=415721 RepID=A0ABN2YW52_9ACTN